MDNVQRLNLIRNKLDIVTAFLDGVNSQCSYSEGSTQKKMYTELHSARRVIDIWIQDEERKLEADSADTP